MEKVRALPFKLGDKTHVKGSEVEIIEYINKKRIKIKFTQSGYVTWVDANQLRTGHIKDCLSPSVYGVGIVGGRIDPEDKDRLSKRSLWSGILRRGFDKNFYLRNPSYSPVTVNPEMFYFPDFYDWCLEQKGNDLEGWQIDKDILFKGNKEYSFTNCCFVPFDINMLFTARKSKRGQAPMGVSFDKNLGKYRSYVNDEGELIHLGLFTDPNEAFSTYKVHKEEIIKKQAEKWKHLIDDKVYIALMNWQVEITD